MFLFYILLLPGNRSKKDLENDAQRKIIATQTLLKNHTSPTLTETEIQRVLDSIADNEAYLSFNVLPVERAIKILKETFNPRQPDEHYSLELKMKLRKSFMSFGGFSSRYMNNSACLSHDHATQYTFVLQHSELGRVEGEGWIAPQSIVQRYWVLGDERQRHPQAPAEPRCRADIQAGRYLRRRV